MPVCKAPSCQRRASPAGASLDGKESAGKTQVRAEFLFAISTAIVSLVMDDGFYDTPPSAGEGATILPWTGPEGLATPKNLDALFDEDGRFWPVGSAMVQALGHSGADLDMLDYAIRKMGWVGIRFAVRHTLVCLEAPLAAAAAVGAAMEVIATGGQERVRLLVGEAGRWHEETLHSPAAAIARLEALGNRAAEPVRRFVVLRQPLEVIFRDKNAGLIRMLQQAASMKETVDVGETVCLARNDSEQRSSVARRRHDWNGRSEPEPGDGRSLTGWIWEEVAPSLRFYRADERAALAGRDIAYTPDAGYGRFCASSYAQSAAADAPIVEDVRALVVRQDGFVVESRYRRLMLPFRAPDASRLVLVKSDFDPRTSSAAA